MENKKNNKPKIITTIILIIIILITIVCISIYIYIGTAKILNNVDNSEERDKIAIENISNDEEYNNSYEGIIGDDFNILNEANTIATKYPKKEDMKEDYNISGTGYYSVNYDILKDLFQNKSSFVLYIGFGKCPWCKSLVPILNEVKEEKGYNILVLDTKAVNKNSDISFNESLEIVKEYIGEYYNTRDDEITIKVPKVFFVKQGKIQYVHEYTVPGHNAKEREITEEEKEEVKESLELGFKRLEDNKIYNFRRNPRYNDAN